MSGDHKEEEDKVFVNGKAGSITMFDFIIVLLKASLGTYGLKLAYCFQTGLIAGILIDFIVAVVSYFGMMLMLKCAVYYEVNSIEDIWEAVVSKRTRFIPGVFSFYAMVVCIYLYFLQIINLFQTAIISFGIDPSSLLASSYIIFIIMFIIIILPTTFYMSFKLCVLQAKIGMILYIFIIAQGIYWFAKYTMDFGFDPTHQLKLFEISGRTAECLYSFGTAFMFAPLVYPGFIHMNFPTYHRWKYVFAWTHILLFLIYGIQGVSGYLTFFDKITNTLTLTLLPMEPIVQITYIATAIMILMTLPFRMNPATYIMFMKLGSKGKTSKGFTFLGGITITLTMFCFSQFRNPYVSIIPCLLEVDGACLVYIFPPILYLVGKVTKNKLDVIIAILVLLYGLINIAFTVWQSIIPTVQGLIKE